MKTSKIITTAASILALAATSTIFAMPPGGNGGGKDKEDPDGGYIDAVFTVESVSPPIPYVTSSSADSKGQIVYYGAMDVSQFPGFWDSGEPCEHLGLRQGTVVIYPESSRNPGKAELLFWFKAEVASGDTVQHLLTMRGTFDEPANWPPSVDDPYTSITLNEWEFSAENKKAQRQDCAGRSDFPAGPWTVNVTRLP